MSMDFSPQRSASLSAGASPGWMVVRIGTDMELALPIEAVGEVMPVPALSPVPMAPAWMPGIISVRGVVVPVVDAGMRLRGRRAGPDGRVVLVHADDTGERVGLLVDGIAGLIERSGARVEERSDDTLPARFVSARVSNGGGERIPVLDLAALLDPSLASGA